MAIGKALFVAALSITLTPVLGANPAHACSCVRGDATSWKKNADLVFKGTVVKRHGEPNGGKDPIVYTFKVSRAYKGHVHRTEKVRTNGSSAACGVNLDGQGPFLVYAHKTDDGHRRLEMNLCGGTHALEKGEKVPYHGHRVR